MKTINPSEKKKSLQISISRKILIIGSALLAFLFYQYSYTQDYDFQQGDDVDYLVVMEAENFSENTPVDDVMWAPTDSPDDYSGEGAMMAVTSAPFASAASAMEGSAVMTYKINFTESGIHYIWARASRTGGGDDSYHAGIDGVIGENGEFLTFHETDFEAGTWGWINYRNNIEPGYVDIPEAGVHELNIYIRENGFRIDKILLTPSDTNVYIPEGTGPDETLAPDGIHITPTNFDENLFTLRTNLVSEELSVIFAKEEFSQGKLEIISSQGSVLRSVTVDNSSQLNLNVSELRSGLYFVKIQMTDHSVLVRKFVKQ
jgi:hypothetical protein